MLAQSLRKSGASVGKSSVRFTTSKSWVPTEDDTLQKVTTQALVHEMSLQQMESVNSTVPWFLKNMPVIIIKRSFYLHRLPIFVRLWKGFANNI